MMCLATDNPAAAKFMLLITFFTLKKISGAKIHHELCMAVYSQNVISEGTVRQLCRMFKDGGTNVHDEEQSGRPAICSE
jgi:hypothetical protein